HERSEILETDHRAFHNRAGRESLRDVRPRVAKRLFQPKRYTPVRLVHSQNHDLYLVARLHYIGRFPDLPRPRHLGEMDQSFDALFQLDEGAEIRDACYGSVNPLANLVFLADL